MISIVHQQLRSFTNSRRCSPSFRSDVVAIVQLRFSGIHRPQILVAVFTFVSRPRRRQSISDFVRFISVILHPRRRRNPSVHPHCRQSPLFASIHSVCFLEN
ncbi:hypothetical protein RHGRI_010126 [Rhododendron griersonianum]|uniref:Uncharacterized protein n=1 Tax=Rhododendron griersonianum TaxID=479676 RepID=A0AAV6KHA0_9ERIC|nr:hypothetical protein RHGRI_010126 [Rhododendron griersonianum]